MDFVAIGKSIADVGGWAAFFALIVLIGVGGYRRWWVFGWLFDRTEARATVSDTQAERNADALETQSKAFAVMATSYDRLERDYASLSGRPVNRD